MLVLDDSCVGGLPVGVVHHGVALEVGSVQHLRLKANGAIGQGPKAEAEIGVDGAGVDHFVSQGVKACLFFQIVCIEPDFDSLQRVCNQLGVAPHRDALVAGGEVIVVVGVAHRQAADDEGGQLPAGAAPLLLSVAVDQFFIDVRTHQGDGLLLQVLRRSNAAAASLGGDDLHGLLGAIHPPHLMEGVHVEGQGVQLPVEIGNGGVGVAVEFGEAVYIIPGSPAVRVEDVGPVAVNLDALHFLGIDVAADVAALLNHQDGFPRRFHLLGEGRPEQAGPHHQIIIVFLVHGFRNLHAGVGGEAAVDGQAYAGDEPGGVVIQQEQHRTHQVLLAVAEAAHGGAVQNPLGAGGGGAVVVIQQLGVLLGGEEAGGDGVDPNPHLGEVNGQPLGEVGNGGLGGGVGGNLGQGQVGVHAGDVQDVAAGPSNHLPGEGLGGKQGANPVQVEHILHAVLVQVEEGDGVVVQIGHFKEFLVGVGLGVVAAGAVDENVAGAQVRLDLLGHGKAVVLAQHVAGVALGAAALGGDFLRHVVQLGQVPAQQGDLGTGPGQRHGENGAQRSAGASDHCHLAGQIGFNHIFHFYILSISFIFRPLPLLVDLAYL